MCDTRLTSPALDQPPLCSQTSPLLIPCSFCAKNGPLAPPPPHPSLIIFLGDLQSTQGGHMTSKTSPGTCPQESSSWEGPHETEKKLQAEVSARLNQCWKLKQIQGLAVNAREVCRRQRALRPLGRHPRARPGTHLLGQASQGLGGPAVPEELRAILPRWLNWVSNTPPLLAFETPPPCGKENCHFTEARGSAAG